MKEQELPIIQKTYDLILWYVPILNRMPRDHKFGIGERLIAGLYDVLEQLVLARYESEKLARLEAVNGKLNVLRYQTRLLLAFDQMDGQRYHHVSKMINEIGQNLGQWIKQQRRPTT